MSDNGFLGTGSILKYDILETWILQTRGFGVRVAGIFCSILFSATRIHILECFSFITNFSDRLG